MITFLFWNLKRKRRQTLVANLASSHKVDVLILAECAIPPDALLVTLNRLKTEYHYAPSIGCEKVEIFTRFPRNFIPAVAEDHRLTIRHLKLPGLTDILLAAIHFPSKNYWQESSQAAECAVLSDIIRQAEKDTGHSRTVLVGDLNMNPFDSGVVNANGLHGVASRHIARKKTRIVQRREYPFFYNPMWSLLGDASSDPPGTYYYVSAEHTAFFWHMFDQVLIRPDLLDIFSNEDLEILQSDGSISFLSPRGIPDENVASDHLPILFRLAL